MPQELAQATLEIVNPEIQENISRIIQRLVAEIPESTEEVSPEPEGRARVLIDRYSMQSAAISGALALPPGPLGLLTVLPDVAMLWRLQIQLVADLAAVFGKTQNLVPDVVLFCLFRHNTSPVFQELAGQAGRGLVIRRSSWQVIQKMSEGIAVRLLQRFTRLAASRFIPVIGAVVVGSCSYRDTRIVGQTALYFFTNETVVMEDGDEMVTVGPVEKEERHPLSK